MNYSMPPNLLLSSASFWHLLKIKIRYVSKCVSALARYERIYLRKRFESWNFFRPNEVKHHRFEECKPRQRRARKPAWKQISLTSGVWFWCCVTRNRSSIRRTNWSTLVGDPNRTIRQHDVPHRDSNELTRISRKRDAITSIGVFYFAE